MTDIAAWKEHLSIFPKFNDGDVIASLGEFSKNVRFLYAQKVKSNAADKSEGTRPYKAPYIWVSMLPPGAVEAAKEQYVIVFEKMKKTIQCPLTKTKTEYIWYPLVVPIGWCAPHHNKFVWPTGQFVKDLAGDKYDEKEIKTALTNFDRENVVGVQLMRQMKFPVNSIACFKEHDMFPAHELGIGPCKCN